MEDWKERRKWRMDTQGHGTGEQVEAMEAGAETKAQETQEAQGSKEEGGYTRGHRTDRGKQQPEEKEDSRAKSLGDAKRSS